MENTCAKYDELKDAILKYFNAQAMLWSYQGDLEGKKFHELLLKRVEAHEKIERIIYP